MTERTTNVGAASAEADVTRVDALPAGVSEPAPAGVSEPAPVGAVARLFAYLIDAVIVAVAIYVVALGLRAILGPTIRFIEVGGNLQVLVNRPRSIVDAAIATAIAGAYFVGSWLTTGRTPGQQLIRARVVAASSGGRLRPGQALVRWLLLGAPVGLVTVILGPPPLVSAVISGLLACWYLVLFATTALDRRKRGLHDRLARSVVGRRGD
jgi:uncharacterized RDD family membrane protein YckC